RGWVKNCPDSSVEIHAEADTGEALAAFWEAVTTQHPRAYVSDCTISCAKSEGFCGFEVRY
ncbi:MAG: acylphosphatase, partial [Treponema sp.]